MKYLVTGGAGFIGSNLTEELVRQGHEVSVIDDLSSGKIANLSSVHNKINFINGSICDMNLLKKSFAGVDVVFHQAAIPSVPRSIANPLASNEANITGTLNVLTAARQAGVRRVVYAASSSAYGNVDAEWKVETMPANPLSPYALTKYAGEAYCRMFTKLYGLETVSLRYFNVFGPKQDPTSQYSAVIPKFITALLKNQNPVIYGDGEQSRDFTFVANNVHANILAATSKKANGHVINIACGESISLNELALKINKTLGTNIKPIHEAERLGDVKDSKADISLAKELLGYTPTVGFDEGLRRTIDYYKKKD